MSSLLITGGRVIDPASGFDSVADLLIRDGRIEAVGANLKADGIASLDHQGFLITVNAQLARMLGYESAENMVGVNFMEHLPPDERSRAADAWEHRSSRVAALRKNRRLWWRGRAYRFPLWGCRWNLI